MKWKIDELISRQDIEHKAQPITKRPQINSLQKMGALVLNDLTHVITCFLCFT